MPNPWQRQGGVVGSLPVPEPYRRYGVPIPGSAMPGPMPPPVDPLGNEYDQLSLAQNPPPMVPYSDIYQPGMLEGYPNRADIIDTPEGLGLAGVNITPEDIVAKVEAERAAAPNKTYVTKEYAEKTGYKGPTDTLSDIPHEFGYGALKGREPQINQPDGKSLDDLLKGIPSTISSSRWGRSETLPRLTAEEVGSYQSESRQRMGKLRESEARTLAESSKARVDERAQLETVAQERKALFDEYKAKRDLIDAEVQKEVVKSKQLLAEIEKTNIDPAQMFKTGRGGAARGIGAVVAIALSGLGQAFQVKGGMRPSGNGAVDIINQAIDRDLRAQVMNLGKKKMAYQGQRNLIADLMKKGATFKESYVLADMQKTREVQDIVRLTKSKTQDEAMWANSERTLAVLEQRIAKDNIELEKEKRKQVTIQSGGSTTANPLLQKLKAMQLKHAMGGAGEGKIIPPKQVAEIGESQATIKNLINYREELKQQMEKYPFMVKATLGKLWGDKANIVYSKQGSITARMRKLIGGEVGIMTDADFKRYEKMMPSLLDTAQGAHDKLSQVIADISNTYVSKLGALQKAGYNATWAQGR